MTPEELAARVGSDPRSVRRWLGDEAIAPHPRTRWKASDALEVSEEMLWPQAVRSAVKLGPDREIVSAYTSRAAVPKTLWRNLITKAGSTIVFAGYTSYFAWLEIPGLRGILQRKAAAGCTVRFLVGDPDSPITAHREQVEAVALTVRTRIAVTLDELLKLREAPGLEARFSDRHISLSVFLFDQQALVCQHLGAGLGHDSPTFHLRRQQEDGLYDRFVGHVDSLWATARPVWPAT